ncbi:flagellar protein [Rhizobium sp. Root708]|uniref:DUF1217 domain-containing protein n=1 Tax=Rhizobium sp. Root708 TaxID=1736592 RepID=UPI0006F6ACEB|nr:DUF1217 domain-containing protein [Rhizobium sp. Root708]KRB61223.1 flagellar protein [Rhizobium sp. Root708]
MVSTYLSYLSVANNLNKSLSAVASKGAVANETTYYKENIGKVTTVDEFMDDYRLYSYAMKAYGLEDMTYAKAFMKKVLESDLSDSTSFANTLSDDRYSQLASAFKFVGEDATAQTSVQQSSLLAEYESSFDEETDSITETTDYYDSSINDVTSVDDFLGSTKLRNYVLEAFGLSTDYTSTSFLRDVLTSDVDDPDSYVNQLGDDAYVNLAKAFNFNTDGSVSDPLQSDDQKSLVESMYAISSSTFASTSVGESYTTYFQERIGSITSVDQLMADDKLVTYLRTAYGLADSDPDNYISASLKSSSLATAIGLGDLHDAFNFDSDGALADGTTAQTNDQTTSTTTAFTDNYNVSDVDTWIDASVSNYQTRLASVTSIEDFLTSNTDDDDSSNDDDAELWQMAACAFGIGSSEITKSQFRKILESDPNDPNSYVNQLNDDRFTALRAAYNFDSDGKTSVPLLAMSQSVIDDFVADYKQNKIRHLSGTDKTEASTAADTEMSYFATQMATLKTASDVLADDRLVNLMLEAKGIDPADVTDTELKKMFASDPDDPDSYVNGLSDNRFAEIVGSFNFDTEGNLSSDEEGTVQQRGDVIETVNNYVRQTLESDQGDSNTGVRLALYFERMAPSVSSAYDILGDDALFEFFTTSFGLSSYVSNMDVEKQAEMVTNFIDLDDLSDPDKVSDLIKRFTAMYDTSNGATTSSASTILSGGSTSISADTLLAVAQLKSG